VKAKAIGVSNLKQLGPPGLTRSDTRGYVVIIISDLRARTHARTHDIQRAPDGYTELEYNKLIA